MSQVFLVPYRVSLPETYLELLQLEKGFLILQNKWGKKSSGIFFQSLERLSRIFCYELQKYPLQFYSMVHHGVTFLRIFPRRFGDRTDVSLPFIHPLFYPIAFGFFIPDITANITCAVANRKPMMCAKQFPCFNTFRMQDHNSFSGISVIPPIRDVAFKKLKNNSKL